MRQREIDSLGVHANSVQREFTNWTYMIPKDCSINCAKLFWKPTKY